MSLPGTTIPKMKASEKAFLASQMNPLDCTSDILRAHLSARGLPFSPTASVSELRRALIVTMTRKPDFEPSRHLVFMPVGTAPWRAVEIPASQAGMSLDRIAEFCCGGRPGGLTDSTILYSEDEVLQMKGNAKGVGVGNLFSTWELFFDDDCLINGAPVNERASTLLRRPNTRGPVVFMKTTFLKTDYSRYTDTRKNTSIFLWVKYTADEARIEFESDVWKQRRDEYERLCAKQSIRAGTITINMPGDGTINVYG